MFTYSLLSVRCTLALCRKLKCLLFLILAYLDRGINGRVLLNGDDITDDRPWLQQPYLTGEAKEYWTEAGQGEVRCARYSSRDVLRNRACVEVDIFMSLVPPSGADIKV